MTINAATIIDSAAGTLLDRAHRTWSASDLLAYLNEALRATAGVQPPGFYVVQTEFTPAIGEEQHLPADGVSLIDVPRNTGGRIVTQVDKGLLDESNRFWPAATKTAVVEHYTSDPRNPLRFVVFPPNSGAGLLDLIYNAVPPQVMYATEDIDVPANYESPLIQFILARCYAKNTKRQDLTKSAAAMQQWGTMLGVSANARTASTPKVVAQPGTT